MVPLLRRFALTAGVFLLVGACVLGAGRLAEPATGVHALGEGALCPVAGCAGECHGYGDVPEPDGAHEMTCPEAGCASVECHAWDTLQGRYHQASDASMNLWILAPVALVVALVALVGALSRPGRGAAAGEGKRDAAAPRHSERAERVEESRLESAGATGAVEGGDAR